MAYRCLRLFRIFKLAFLSTSDSRSGRFLSKFGRFICSSRSSHRSIFSQDSAVPFAAHVLVTALVAIPLSSRPFHLHSRSSMEYYNRRHNRERRHSRSGRFLSRFGRSICSSRSSHRSIFSQDSAVPFDVPVTALVAISLSSRPFHLHSRSSMEYYNRRHNRERRHGGGGGARGFPGVPMNRLTNVHAYSNSRGYKLKRKVYAISFYSSIYSPVEICSACSVWRRLTPKALAEVYSYQQFRPNSISLKSNLTQVYHYFYFRNIVYKSSLTSWLALNGFSPVFIISMLKTVFIISRLKTVSTVTLEYRCLRQFRMVFSGRTYLQTPLPEDSRSDPAFSFPAHVTVTATPSICILVQVWKWKRYSHTSSICIRVQVWKWNPHMSTTMSHGNVNSLSSRPFHVHSRSSMEMEPAHVNHNVAGGGGGGVGRRRKVYGDLEVFLECL